MAGRLAVDCTMNMIKQHKAAWKQFVSIQRVKRFKVQQLTGHLSLSMLLYCWLLH